jgi:hypothetical protein
VIHAVLNARLRILALVGLAIAVTLTIAARQPEIQQVSSPATAFFSDFDSDDHPDEIELISSGTSKSISVHLSHSATRNLFFDSEDPRAGTLLAADIDLDQALDLIWITPNRPSLAKVWLGDGHGNFEMAPEPSRYLKAVAALEASSQGSNVAGGAGAPLPIATTSATTGVYANSGGFRPIAFIPPSLPKQASQPCPLSLHGFSTSERGPPLHS